MVISSCNYKMEPNLECIRGESDKSTQVVLEFVETPECLQIKWSGYIC